MAPHYTTNENASARSGARGVGMQISDGPEIVSFARLFKRQAVFPHTSVETGQHGRNHTRQAR